MGFELYQKSHRLRTCALVLTLSALDICTGTSFVFAETTTLPTGGDQPRSAPFSSGVRKFDSTDEDQKARALLDPEFEKCGQDCDHQKAIETISIMIDTAFKKMRYLRSGYANDPNFPNDFDIDG